MMARESLDWETALKYCRGLNRHYENFTVGSYLFPRRLRPFLQVIYAFARYSDDLADEVGDPEAFHVWMEKVKSLPRTRGDHPLLFALQHTREMLDLPLEPFTDLLAAFARDLEQRPPADWESVLDYCRYSANPVGRLVLLMFGYREEELLAYSDAVCTGLQLVNFLQDVREDAQKGRVYLPENWLREAGIWEEIREGRYSRHWIPVLERVAREAQAFLEQGRPLIRRVSFPLSYELKLFVGGGLQALSLLRRNGFSPDAENRLQPRHKLAVALRSLLGTP